MFQLKDIKTVPDIVHEYPDSYRNGNLPIIIDNGSYNCRAGWAIQENPSLIFKNLIAKTRKEKGRKDGSGEIQVGNEITNIEAVRFQLKMQFDRNIVTQFEVQEQLFDYTFYHLGINTDGSVNHPILLTEPFLNLNYSRQLMSELLFECYNVPSLNYSVDCLLSFNEKFENKSGLVISCGYHTTHIIPVLDGVVDASRSRRINLGGFHIVSYLHKLLQLKYPAHFNAITLSRAEELIHDHCHISHDYKDEVQKWSESSYYDDHVSIAQLPYTAPTVPTPLSLEQQKEKKKELAKRLIEINARKREEKLAEDEETLNNLLNARELYELDQYEEFEETLQTLEINNFMHLNKEISTIEARIEKTRQKIAAANSMQQSGMTVVVEEQQPKPVSQILGPKDMDDFDMWLSGIREQRQTILNKRTARRQRKRDLAQRRTAAAQERMRLISQLARKDKKDDNFGSKDEDWDVYKVINKDGGSSDSEEESERLNELENVLRHHDPNFDPGNNSEIMAPGESHQLHLAVERIRAPEVLFQPALMGSSEAGLAETIDFVLKKFSSDEQMKLVSNVFLTGGCVSFRGLLERLTREMREFRPFQSTFNVTKTEHPVLSAWYGGRKLANSSHFNNTLFTKHDYEERGGEYFKTHSSSNCYFPSPAPAPAPAPANPTT